ncbi:MAG: hypothetical protein D6685_13530 [Bacteroidetes bacterium]|nr:hypothetical protein AWN76_007625 [Rhodothermaceae bacterium RA]RMH56148.1 MAG: hypothetical protein D6685_13530 [Bacteroidota bacterium]
MFNERAFGTWPLVLTGAALFAALFMLVGLMAEGLFDGELRFTRTIGGFGLAAFSGYVFVAMRLRHEQTRSQDP